MSSIEKALERLERKGATNGRTAKTEDRESSGLTGSQPKAQQLPSPQQPHKATTSPRRVHKLNIAAMEKAGFIVPNSQRSTAIEEFRVLKRPVLMNAFGRGAAPIENGNLVMVTSTVPGEGKTSTTINLAMSMAIELDTTVLMVDADLIRPTLTGIFDLQNEPGLVDVLLDEDKDLSDVIVTTDIEKLRILPAGRAHLHSTELLSSAGMRRLALDLARRYTDRVILLDSPPLLAASESQVLSDLAGQILVVVESGKTTQHAIKEAVSRLDKNKAIGMVLNKSNPMFKRGYYYGSYGSTR